MKYLKIVGLATITALLVIGCFTIDKVFNEEVPQVNITEKRKNNNTLGVTKKIDSTTNTKVQFDEDVLENMHESMPKNMHYPLGLQAQFDMGYKGAFRAYAKNNVSSSSYAVGVIAYNPKKHSLFLAGHAHHNAIAEFKIPDTLSFQSLAQKIPNAKVLQNYIRILDKTKNNKITGMLAYKDSLLVTSEIWYDGSGKNKDNLQVLNINNITEKPKGMLQLAGAAKIAGYMSKIPSNMQEALGGEHLVGWSSVYSITSRYSQGPSLAIFNPQDAVDSDLLVHSDIKQVYPLYKGDLVKGADKYTGEPASPIWSPLAKGRYGFIVPDTNIFMVVGSHAGIHSGIGYKIIQQGKSRPCPGGCTNDPKDNYNYFWLFNVNEMLATENQWDVKPFSYGKWQHPFSGQVLGATFDDKNDMLYMSLSGAGRTGKYDRPPMIISYKIVVKSGG